MKYMIEVNRIWKEYKRGAQKEAYLSLRDRISGALKSGNKRERFYALEDINFKVDTGVSTAVIGKNGAGKSTLLKILSRITPPTKGEIVLRGRLASLLEVGTGFHPELTGRENVYLNGSILGLKRFEINRYFDEIVDFSGVEAFLETPLKHYSSGMQLRLAFAVAAHLEPEILVIDEVLAVGDVEFQKKCIGKMKDVAGQGRTVIFVSHDLAAVKNLCTRAILLEEGRIHIQGHTDDVIDAYISKSGLLQSKNFTNNSLTQNSVRIKSFDITSSIETGKPFSFEAVIFSNENTTTDFAIAFRTLEDTALMHVYSGHVGENFKLKRGESKISGKFDPLPLGAGHYSLNLWLGFGKVVHDFHSQALKIFVNEGAIRIGGPVSTKNGYPVIIDAKWELK